MNRDAWIVLAVSGCLVDLVLAAEVDAGRAELTLSQAEYDALIEIPILSPVPFSGGWQGGHTMRISAEVSMDIVNSQQRILPGYRLNTSWFDDRCNPDYGVQLMISKWMEADYVALGANGCSAVCRATALLTPSMRVPHISYGCAAGFLQDNETFPDFGRLLGDESAMADVFRALGRSHNWTRMVIITGSPARFDGPGQALMEYFRDDPLDVEWLVPRNPGWDDMLLLMQEIKRTFQRVIIVLGYEPFYRRAVCASILVGIPKGVVWLSVGWHKVDWWSEDDPDLLALAPQCTPEALTAQYNGGIGASAYASPSPEDMEKPLDCLAGYTPQSYRDKIDEYFVSGYPLSQNMLPGQAYQILPAGTADGICIWAYTFRYMLLEENHTLSELIRPSDAIYKKMRNYIKNINFWGVMGRIFWDGSNVPGILAVQQVQEGKKTLVSMLNMDGVLSEVVGTTMYWGDGSIAPPSSFAPCDDGYLRDADGVCVPCAKGTYFYKLMNDCLPCEQGEYNPLEGAVGSLSCLQCANGQVANETGMSTCKECPEGKFSNPQEGFGAACVLCSAGTYEETVGSSECRRCDLGSYQPTAGAPGCFFCPGSRTTRFLGAVALDECICPRGEYQPLGNVVNCLPCPDGFFCDSQNTTEAAFLISSDVAQADLLKRFPSPMVAPGFMTRPRALLLAFRCLVSAWCPGGISGSCALNRDSTAVGCSRCKRGYFESGAECQRCSGGESAALITLGIVAGVGALVFLTFAVNRNVLLQPQSIMSCIVMLGLSFTGIQTITAFRNLAVDWPEPLKSMIEALSLLSFDLKLFRVECMIGSGAFVKFLMRQLVAPGSAVVIVIAIAVKKRFMSPLLDGRVEAINTIGSIFQVFFLSIFLSATTPFVCYKHPGEAGYSMVSSPDVLCYRDAAHTGLIGISIATVIAVVLPFLVITVWATWKFPEFVRPKTGSDLYLRTFRFLFFRYRPEAYYYGLITLLRALLICLVPVALRDLPAVQILAMAMALLSFTIAQALLQPWRSGMSNLVDGVLGGLMIFMLICLALASDTKDVASLMGALGAAMFVLFFVVSVATLTYGIYLYLAPRPYFHRFICHHKADAAAQARYLQLLLVQRTGKSCFLDSDNLTDLNELFDIVRCRIGQLVVLLTSDTLRRPWCAGEVTVAAQTHKRMVLVKAPSFSPPTAQDLQSIECYLDSREARLLQYGITPAFVSEAFEWLLSAALSSVELPSSMQGCAKFQAVVDFLVGGRVPSKQQEEQQDGDNIPESNSEKMLGGMRPGMFVVSSDPADDEATATAGILASKAQARILDFVSAGTCVLVDLSDSVTPEVSNMIFAARAVAVVLTKGSLESAQQLQVICDCIGDGSVEPVPAIPVNTPSFRFPGDDFYSNNLVARFPGGIGDDVANRVRNFFRWIAVIFSTKASEKVLQVQALEIVGRVPQKQNQCVRSSSLRLDQGDHTGLSVEEGQVRAKL